jgi:hypothetical protein
MLIILSLLGVSEFLYSQKIDSTWSGDNISNATVYLQQRLSDSSGIGGAGTIIKKAKRYFLLSASHVTSQLRKDAEIVFRMDGDKPLIRPLNSLVKGRWEDHPIADISICELAGTSDDSVDLALKNAFPFELIKMDEEALPKDFEVHSFGYPIFDAIGKYFSPLSYKTNLASGLLTDKRYDNHALCVFFFLQDPGMQGFSGGGVYAGVNTISATRYRLSFTLLIGVSHGTRADATGGKFSAITPSFYIKDLFSDK